MTEIRPGDMRLTEGEPQADEDRFDRTLRPRTLAEFVGQEDLKVKLGAYLDAARGRDEPLDHLLLAGPPGVGKTTLAGITADALGTRMVSTSGPVLERPADLCGVLTGLGRGDVLFIDEVHRLPRTVEEYLYSAMDDARIDIVLDSGPTGRMVRLDLEPFTLVAATTREGLLGKPFRDRFGIVERLLPYSAEELVAILRRTAGLLEVTADDDALGLLAERARGTPRVANRLLRRVRDLVQAAGAERIAADDTARALATLGVDEAGLEDLDRRVLGVLCRAEGPLGLKHLAVAVGETEDVLEEVCEPYLIRRGFVERTPRGRTATAAAHRHLGDAAAGPAGLFD